MRIGACLDEPKEGIDGVVLGLARLVDGIGRKVDIAREGLYAGRRLADFWVLVRDADTWMVLRADIVDARAWWGKLSSAKAGEGHACDEGGDRHHLGCFQKYLHRVLYSSLTDYRSIGLKKIHHMNMPALLHQCESRTM